MNSNFIDDLKSRLDIREYISRDLTLNRSNKACCPFHDDKTPSFSVNFKGQFFHCFGCGAGGDIVSYVMKSKSVPFVEAVRMLAKEAGLSVDQSQTHDNTAQVNSRLRSEILLQSANFYRESLTEEASQYLASRGITEATINRFQIGWAGGGLRTHLIDKLGFSAEECISAGVLKQRESGIVDYFYNRVIFPNCVRGRIVHLTGRTIADSEVKYLHLPGSIDYLYNEDAAANDEVIVAEGAIDCLTLVQQGYNAVAILGAGGFKPCFAERLRSSKVVFVVLDGDTAGKSGSERICSIIPEQSIPVELPTGLDINDFFRTNGTELFLTLLNKSKPYLECELEEISNRPPNQHLAAIPEFVAKLQQCSEFARTYYSSRLQREFKIPAAAIKKLLQPPEVSDEAQPPSSTEGVMVSEELKERALDLLTDPSLLQKVVSTLDEIGCVGEVDNKVLACLTLTSRLLKKPINLIVKGESSAGKSYLIEKVSQLFPEDQVLKFTSLTPMSLYHIKESLSHKALIVFERPGAEASDYPIRSLQSEGNLTLAIPVKNPETNQFITEHIKVEGPVAYIETTTRAHLHEENETRCLELFVDDSEEQTGNVISTIKSRYTVEGITKSVDLEVFKVAQGLLKCYPVLIPFVDAIRFPTKPLRVRRDFQSFLSLIEASAILHQYQREKRTVNGVETVIAAYEDYGVAYGLVSTVLKSCLRNLTPHGEALAHEIHDILKPEDGSQFTMRDLLTRLHKDRKTIAKYLHELENNGLIEIESSGRGKATTYRFIRLPNKFDNVLISPEELVDVVEALKLEQVSKPEDNANGQVKTFSASRLDAVVQANSDLVQS